MEDLTLPKRVKVSEEVLFQTIEDESVLLNLTNEKYFGLDEVGTRIWHLLTEYDETAEVLTKILAEYDIDENTLSRDMKNLIDNLNEQGLISIES